MASTIPNRWFSFPFTICYLLLLSLSPPAISSVLRLPSDGRIPGAGDGDVDVCPLPEPPGSCPVKCFRPDPVCGEDGVTYWCGCADAHCAGTRVAKMGFCEVGNGGSGPISGQALLLAHIVWLIVLGFSVLFGLL